MLLELDTGLANVSAALESNGMLDRAIFFIHTGAIAPRGGRPPFVPISPTRVRVGFHKSNARRDFHFETRLSIVADNGGPASHACNYPLRGGTRLVGFMLSFCYPSRRLRSTGPRLSLLCHAGKFTFWEGGVRGFAVASSKLFPAAVRGTQFNGMAHLADLYATIIVGIAGMVIPLDTGPIPPDSHNLWDALMNGTASPRTEVTHLPCANSVFPSQHAPFAYSSLPVRKCVLLSISQRGRASTVIHHDVDSAHRALMEVFNTLYLRCRSCIFRWTTNTPTPRSAKTQLTAALPRFGLGGSSS